MWTPTAKAALTPALSIMQSIVTDQARLRESNQPDSALTTPTVAVTPGYDTQATQKLNAYYFGDHQTASEVRTKIFTYLAKYVGEEIDTVEKELVGDTAGNAPAVSSQLADSLKGMEADVRDGLRTSLDNFSQGGQSLQATAARMLMTLDLDVLSNDKKITKYLEQMIGFDLGTMNAKDILTAFVDPDGKENDKLRSIISNALAGTDGSKAMQRLGDAAKGLHSVEETKQDIEDVKPYDEVDEETKEEDKSDIKTAKAYDTLNEARDFIEGAAEDDVTLAEVKAAIEAAKSAATPGGTPTSSTVETDAEPDPADADHDKTSLSEDRWGYGDQDDETNIRHTGTTALYL
ncbi:hypothetical protein [uncultured Hoeflea sp.]|uniref:hypothetical protein n=1 Tax=uncultured Hoeflea sp. TaxID=538666 RepID=UPI0030DDADCE